MAGMCPMAPRTGAEQRTFAQLSRVDQFFQGCQAPGMGAYAMSSGPTSSFDMFVTRIDDEYLLDYPVFCALLPQLATQDPQGTAQLVAEFMGDQLPKDPGRAESAFERFWAAAKDAAFDWGNVPGNVVTSAEIALRAAWKVQIRLILSGLAAGRVIGSVKLTPHIRLEPFRIGKGGDLRKGAAIKVRIQGLPVRVMQSLPASMVMKAGGGFGSMRVSPANTRSVVAMGDVLTNARRQSSTFLRAAGARGAPGVLAFGPSAVMDLYDNTSRTNDGVSVNWKGFAVSSAASQSGNAVGMFAGALATGVAAGVGGVAIAGTLPVLVVAFGVGLIAQAAWNYSGMDKEASGWVKSLLD